MIRPFTLLTAVIFLLSGAYMFAIKHRAEATEMRISQIDHQSLLDAQRIRVLQAQWALETDPDRLSQLAGAFTALTPMKPVQLVTMQALAARLPAPGAAVPAPNPQETAPLTVPEVATATGNATANATALPLPPDAAPVKLASVHAPVRVARGDGLSDVEHLLHHLNTHAAPPRPVRLARASPPVRHDIEPAAAVDGAQVVATRALVSGPSEAGSLLGMAQTGLAQTGVGN